MDRNETIKTLKDALKNRSGKTWSVTGGRGTAWGWIEISAPPKRCTGHWTLKPGHLDRGHEDWELTDTGVLGGCMTPKDREELTQLLSLDRLVGSNGESIPSGGDYYEEYIQRAQGLPVTVRGEQYWD